MPATSPLLTIGTPTYRRPSHIRARIDEVAASTPLSRTLGNALQDVITADSGHPRTGG